MIERISSKTKQIFFGNCEHKLMVDEWICPLCQKHQVSVYVDGGIEYGGEFSKGHDVAGCIECWPQYF